MHLRSGAGLFPTDSASQEALGAAVHTSGRQSPASLLGSFIANRTLFDPLWPESLLSALPTFFGDAFFFYIGVYLI